MSHDLVSEAELRGKAETDCRAVVRGVSANEARIDVANAATEWDEEDLRHVFEFNAEIWLDGFGFTVVLDAAGRPAGYVDESKWRRCSGRKLTADKVVGLAVKTGFVTAAAVVIEIAHQERGSIVATLHSNPRDPRQGRYRVVVNPVLEQIISILPEEIAE